MRIFNIRPENLGEANDALIPPPDNLLPIDGEGPLTPLPEGIVIKAINLAKWAREAPATEEEI